MGYLNGIYNWAIGNKLRGFLTMLMLGIVTFGGCKKSSEPNQPLKQAARAENLENIVSKTDVNEINKETSEKVPLRIEYPKPMFIGTPTDIRRSYKVEDTTGKKSLPFYVPFGTKNLALGKPVYSSDDEPIIGELELVTDGDKEATDGSYVELGPFKQHVTIDLGKKSVIYAIVVWHYHKEPRIYNDVIVQVADDSDFILNVKTIFNNDWDNSSGLGVESDLEYVENNNGKLIDAKGVETRYVRFYSNGNSSNDINHYIEAEVYGKE